MVEDAGASGALLLRRCPPSVVATACGHGGPPVVGSLLLVRRPDGIGIEGSGGSDRRRRCGDLQMVEDPFDDDGIAEQSHHFMRPPHLAQSTASREKTR